MGDVHANDVRANQFELYLSILYSLYCNRPMHVHPCTHAASSMHPLVPPPTRDKREQKYTKKEETKL